VTGRSKRTDIALWAAIAAYTGVIYSTLGMVSPARKWLVERFGENVFDCAYWILAIIGCAIAGLVFRRMSGIRRIVALAALCIMAAFYIWYLPRLEFAVERVHLIEYGIMGALLFIAAFRRMKSLSSIIAALSIGFWISMGDEAIQHALPGRVGEMRDALINLLSMGLGAILPATIMMPFGRLAVRIDRAEIKTVIALLAVTMIAITVFIPDVHGFGHTISDPATGRFYSAFRKARLASIDTTTREPPRGVRRVYENEAARHLLQREFYLTNDFKGRDGFSYRMYDRSFCENRILERYFPRFLREHGSEPAAMWIRPLDRELARRLVNTVAWPDSVRERINGWLDAAFRDRPDFQSRVKSTMVTSLPLPGFVALMALVLGALIAAYRVVDKCGTSWVRTAHKTPRIP
jgi:uncharacterized membrane protein YoaK (UPF0700 family)